MKKITNIGGALIIAVVLSFPFLYLGSILALGGVYGVVTFLLWYAVTPLIFIISIYIGYRNSKSENPSRVFTWVIRICVLMLLGYLIWWTSFIVKNIVPSNQRVESNQSFPVMPAGKMIE
jgi:uncharacterized membrane-anchored protein